MCPDKKIDWFTLNEDWRPEDHAEVDRIVRARWTETYLKRSATPNDVSNKPSLSEKVPERVIYIKNPSCKENINTISKPRFRSGQVATTNPPCQQASTLMTRLRPT